MLKTMNANTLNDVFYSSNNKEELVHNLIKLTTDINSPLSKIFAASLNKTSALLPFFISINEYLFTLNSKTVSQSFYNILKDYITLDVLDIYFDYQLIDADKDDNFFINLAEGSNNFNEPRIVSTSFSTVQKTSESGQLNLFDDVIRPFNLLADGVAKHFNEDNGLDEETRASEVESKNELLNELIVINIPADEKQSENSKNTFNLSEGIKNIIDIESIDEVSGFENIEDLESYDDFIPSETDEDEINFDEEDYSALDDYVYDFEDEELDNFVDLGIEDNTVSREKRAQQKAVEFIMLSEWSSKKYLGLISDIFYRYGWSATKTALERLLEFDLSPTELELLFEIKIFWEENDHYWIAFERGRSSYSYSQHVMSWNSALKIVRAFDSYPCIEEIVDVIDRLYEVWMSKKILQRKYWRFIGFVWLWAFEIKGFLPASDSYVFENNDFTPEAWQDNADLFEVQLICDKERLGLPAPQVGDPYWYWTERRIQLSNQELNAETTKE